MAENKVRFLRGTSAEYANAVKDEDTFYYTTDDEKFYVGSKEITGGGITVDSELSDTSGNSVENKVIKQALDNKVNISDLSNNNLIVNSNFMDVVNSTDKTSFDGKGEYIDLWYSVYNNAAADITENGLEFHKKEGTTLSGSILVQDITQNLALKTITLSADITNTGTEGNVSAAIQVGATNVAQVWWSTGESGIKSISYNMPEDYATLKVAFRINATTASGIAKWVKLEIGDNPTEYISPVKELEVLKVNAIKNNIATLDDIPTVEANVQSDWNITDTSSDAYILNKPSSLPANGGNADTVNGHTVEKDVPADAVFTDTVYSLPTAGLNALGGVKTTSSVTSSSGYTPCPIISGVPYYKDTNTTYTLSSLGVTMSTSSASGGSDGNVHFKYS